MGLERSVNRQLQAAFYDIGIARADWVQAGLLSNPSLGVGILFPEGGGRSNLQVNISFSPEMLPKSDGSKHLEKIEDVITVDVQAPEGQNI